MSPLVLDCSIALAWIFPDEASPATDAVLDRVSREGAIVPALWHLELGNVLVMAERRGRLTWAEAQRRLQLLGHLGIETAVATDPAPVIDLARAERLTVYDATYLHMALGGGFDLATLDRPLGAAAKRLGVQVVPAVAD